MKRGVLGGTFNPIHTGHLLIAEDVRTALGLADVLFVPAGEPWMKLPEALAPKEHRWEMVVRATATNPLFVPSRVDLDRPGPSYAVDTIRELIRRQRGPCSYYYIMGVDTLEGLAQWKEPERLLELCRIAAVARPGHDGEAALAAASRALPGLAERLEFVQGALVDISATDIRRRCEQGLSIKYRVPEAVEAYILEHGIYRRRG